MKCDEIKPKCQRCTDLGIDCPGYRGVGDVEFRDQTCRYSRHPKRKSGSNSDRQCSLPVIDSRSGSLEPTRQGSPEMSSSTTSIYLDPKWRASLRNDFFLTYLPNDATRISSHYAFLTALPSPEIDNPALNAAVDTLACVYAGTLRRNEQLLSEARRLYSKALSLLCQSLSRPDIQNCLNTLAAIQLLSFCEEFRATNTDGHGLNVHTQGARDFIQTGKLSCTGSHLGQLLFYTNRYACTSDALAGRHATEAVPSSTFKNQLTPDDDFIVLTDLLAYLPQVFHEVDQISSTNSPFDKSQSFDRVFNICMTLQRQLQVWFESLRNKTSGVLHSLVDVDYFQTFKTLNVPKTIPAAFDFQSFWHAYLISRYWMATSIISWNLSNAIRQMEAHSPDVSLPESSIFEAKASDFAMRVCQTVPFCWEQESCGFVGCIYSRSLLQYAGTYFATLGVWPPYAWCTSIEDRLRDAGITAGNHPRANGFYQD